MSAPRIGITRDGRPGGEAGDASYRFYATSVEKAGGTSVPIGYTDDLARVDAILDSVQAMIFSGGDDLDPARWGEQRHPKAKPVEPARERFELALLARAEQRRMPILGICLGAQLLNVHRGGTLIQFLPEWPRENPLEHRRLDAAIRRHSVRLESGSLLAGVLGKTEILANTYHKQAIRTLGRGLRATAWAPDGIIEAIEDPAFPLLLGVQWHPERLHEEADHLRLFELLVRRAR